jgi:beta-lactamase class A
MNNFFKTAAALIIFTRAVAIFPAYSQTDLRMSIGKLIATVDGEIGVGIRHLERGDTLSVSGDDHFPMQSVFKFHLALAVLHEVDEGRLSLDQEVLVKKQDYISNTWSPIAAKHPEGNIYLTIRDLISYTVASSDNNGCDVLFGLLGGPDKVNAFIVGLGINDIAIKNTEREMHQSWDLQFKNWTTPVAMVNILDMYYKGQVLAPKTTAFLRKTLEETITGNNRIKGLLPVGTTVAHKTGMGERNGVIGAVNDVGVITLPNGHHVSIALFITKTSESVPTLEKLMAEISRSVFDYYSRG